jgi:hypothetical protein
MRYTYGTKESMKMRKIRNMNEKICRECGKTERDHHEFDPMMPDPRCMCDPRDWFDDGITRICPEFTPRDEDQEQDGRCKVCEHVEACHG